MEKIVYGSAKTLNPLHPNIDQYAYSPYFPYTFLRFWKGECVEQSLASLVVDHFPYSHDLMYNSGVIL